MIPSGELGDSVIPEKNKNNKVNKNNSTNFRGRFSRYGTIITKSNDRIIYK